MIKIIQFISFDKIRFCEDETNRYLIVLIKRFKKINFFYWVLSLRCNIIMILMICVENEYANGTNYNLNSLLGCLKVRIFVHKIMDLSKRLFIRLNTFSAPFKSLFWIEITLALTQN